MTSKAFRIWIADDDFEDFQIIKKTFHENKQNVQLSHIEDGQYLIDILKAQSKNNKFGELPNLILLDLKLPKVDGLEILRQLKANERTSIIPVVILTSSKEENDIITSYQLGINSYIVKPVNFESFTKAVAELGMYWILLNQHTL